MLHAQDDCVRNDIMSWLSSHNGLSWGFMLSKPDNIGLEKTWQQYSNSRLIKQHRQ